LTEDLRLNVNININVCSRKIKIKIQISIISDISKGFFDDVRILGRCWYVLLFCWWKFNIDWASFARIFWSDIIIFCCWNLKERKQKYKIEPRLYSTIETNKLDAKDADEMTKRKEEA